MDTLKSGRKRTMSGFTLIELLVVVAIIALLIAILLPSLGKARENARTAVCATHMRQIAIGNLLYIDQNNQTMITVGISTSVPFPGGQIPHEQFWATDLAAQGYLPSKNNISPAGTTPIPSLSSVFACPDGLLQENPVSPSSGGAQYTGGFPRSDYNRYYLRQTATTPASGDFTVFTWYALNGHNISTQSNLKSPGGAGSGQGGSCPFVQWNKSGSSGETPWAPGGYARRLQMITAQSRMVLLVEASAVSWDANGNIPPSSPDQLPPTTGHPQRLSGRHGDAVNTYDGYTNFAFFDGHVGKYSTAPYSNTQWAYEIAHNGTIASPVQDTLFYIQQQ
ncbi:MAG: prepilin-type N-terminal cleavage/methylation domain-containing protein [Phycisphaerae bacterium]